MKNSISIIILVALVLAGGWFFLSQENDDGHEKADKYGHEDHEIVAKEPVRADGTFSIVASFYPLAFALETLTEGVAEVTNISGARDPHDVQLTTQDVLAMQQADLVVLQGAELEPWGDDIVDQLKREEIPVLLATHGLELMESGHDEHEDKQGEEHEGEEEYHDEDEEYEDEHGHGDYDPHTWLDPVLFSQTIGELIEALIILDPENAEVYEERGSALQAELATLDTEYNERLATCALDEVITSHDAFGYLGERYGFEIHTIAGISTQDAPSAKTLAELREEAEEGIGAILLEENSNAAFGATLASETGLQTLSINPVAYLVSEGEDYFSIMRANLNTFADALQCS